MPREHMATRRRMWKESLILAVSALSASGCDYIQETRSPAGQWVERFPTIADGHATFTMTLGQNEERLTGIVTLVVVPKPCPNGRDPEVMDSIAAANDTAQTPCYRQEKRAWTYEVHGMISGRVIALRSSDGEFTFQGEHPERNLLKGTAVFRNGEEVLIRAERQ